MGRETPKRVSVKLNQCREEIREFVRLADNLKLRGKIKEIKEELKLL